MKALMRDDTVHGVEYVERSEADAEVASLLERLIVERRANFERETLLRAQIDGQRTQLGQGIEYAIHVGTSMGPAWVRLDGHIHSMSDDPNHCDRFATSAQAGDYLEQLRRRYPGNRFEVRAVPKRVEEPRHGL